MRDTHAPPLFVHGNLLKHSAGYKKGSTYTTIKRMKHDNVSEVMDNPRTVVYNSRQGMCVDVWDSFDDVDPRRGGGEDATFNNGEVVMESSDDAFGGLLRGYESM